MPTKAQLTKSLDRYQAQLAEAERQRDEAIRVARHQEQSLKESQAQTASANSQITDLQERLSRIRDAIATAAAVRFPGTDIETEQVWVGNRYVDLADSLPEEGRFLRHIIGLTRG